MSSVTENIRHHSTEHQLIEKIQQGDTDAFAKLYDKYATVLLGVILKIVVDQKTADELLQRSFMRFWMEISSFDPMKESLLMWMLTITRQTAFAAVSQKNKTAEIQHPGNSVNNSNPELTPEKASAVFDSPHHEKQLSVADMVYFKGYSLARAAGELNITVAALKKRLRMEFKTQGGKRS
jgi:RNA polymerase sigma-70 factor (ECF subfamily)